MSVELIFDVLCHIFLSIRHLLYKELISWHILLSNIRKTLGKLQFFTLVRETYMTDILYFVKLS